MRISNDGCDLAGSTNALPRSPFCVCARVRFSHTLTTRSYCQYLRSLLLEVITAETPHRILRPLPNCKQRQLSERVVRCLALPCRFVTLLLLLAIPKQHSPAVSSCWWGRLLLLLLLVLLLLSLPLARRVLPSRLYTTRAVRSGEWIAIENDASPCTTDPATVATPSYLFSE
jgi:hypothetical protein